MHIFDKLFSCHGTTSSISTLTREHFILTNLSFPQGNKKSVNSGFCLWLIKKMTPNIQNNKILVLGST